jgi:hypothetical protein
MPYTTSVSAIVNSARARGGGVASIFPTLRCRDPLGREIVLMDDVWYGKVLNRRPELHTVLNIVEQTLTDPEAICDDKLFDNRECYYREDVLPAPHGWSFLKVVVQFTDDEGSVVTVYPDYGIHPLERCTWHR